MTDQPNHPHTPEEPEPHADDAAEQGHAHDHDHDHAHDHDHDHAHGHDHDHGDPFHPQVGEALETDELDPAQRSLADALRISFGILTVIMVLLIVAFVFSGTRNIEEGTVGVRLLFGAVHGEPGQRVLEPGLYTWPPAPIGEFIILPTTSQRVDIDEQFLFEIPARDRNKPYDQLVAQPTLTPGKDGSLITGDQNVVHGRWSVNYVIRKADAVDFIVNVGLTDPTNPQERAAMPAAYFTRSRLQQRMYKADQLVRRVAERAIIHVVATIAVDDFVGKAIPNERIRTEMRRMLDELRAGIEVESVSQIETIAPLSVRAAFQQATTAESEKATAISNARKEANTILSSAAGSVYPAFDLAIKRYEVARNADDEEAAARAHAAIDALLGGQTTAAQALEPLEGDPQVDPRELADARINQTIDGEARIMVNEAEAYRRNAESQVEAEQQQFLQRLASFRANPRIFLNRTWQETREQIFSQDVETWYTPSSPDKTITLQLDPDPKLQKEREAARYRQQNPQNR